MKAKKQPKKIEFKNILDQRTAAVLLFLLSAAIIVLPFFFKIRLQDFQHLGILGIFLLNLLGSATIFLPAPVILSVGIGGYYYNPILVALAASLGSSAGEAVGYLFGDTGSRVFNFKKHKLIYFIFKTLFTKYGTAIILILSIIPNPFIDGVGIFAGISSYSLKKFLIVVFIGRLIRNLIIATAGHYF